MHISYQCFKLNFRRLSTVNVRLQLTNVCYSYKDISYNREITDDPILILY